MSDLDKINALDEEIRSKSAKLLRMRNKFLRDNGWEITCEDIGPIKTYFYQKFGDLYICEQEAIDREVNW